jgi:hypothetical protein
MRLTFAKEGGDHIKGTGKLWRDWLEFHVNIPVIRQNPIRPRNQQVVSASTSSYLV